MRKLGSLSLLTVFSALAIMQPQTAVAGNIQKLNVISSAFSQNSVIPKKFTGDGQDLSPALSWSAPPAVAKSIAITVEDPDAPKGVWWHWIIFNLSPKTQSLGEGVNKVGSLAGGVAQGVNDFNKLGYNGPAPPPNQNHHYIFKVVALDTVLTLKPGCNKDAFRAVTTGHIVAEGQLIGTYSR